MATAGQGQSSDVKLPAEIRLLIALAGLAAISHPSVSLSQSQIPFYKGQSSAWLDALLKLLDIPRERLPKAVRYEDALDSSKDAASEWTEAERLLIATTLVQASLAAAAGGPAAKDPTTTDKAKELLKLKSANDEKAQSLAYTPLSRSFAHRTLHLLSLSPIYLAEAEMKLAISLFEALKTTADPAKQDQQVEEARKSHEAGWGGPLGRALAIGVGTIGAGVLLGVTGGLAAPGIAAVLAPLGISGGLLSASVAPVALGTLFGIGGGGLAGRRVSERWRGVADFGFVEVGKGTKQTKEEVEDMKQVKARAQEDSDKGTSGDLDGGEQEKGDGRIAVEQRLLELSLDSPRGSLDEENPRKSLHSAQGAEEKSITDVKKPPSLIATIVVPGLLTVSGTEAITSWRALCADSLPTAPVLPGVRPAKSLALADGRDVYVLRFETAGMLKTGREVDFWVTNKLKKKVVSEVIKRTVFNAYMAAVALPLSVYSMATMSLDNTWMQAQDKACKAGRILGEVIEKKVQGERPVILIGSSLGALTVHHALQYLASLPPPTGVEGGPVPQFVESAFLISLPSAPTRDEWNRSRHVVARRLVNAWSSNDYVLAGVVRLHEVVSKAAVMSSGLKVAGLGPVEMAGVEDVDVSSALGGHFELQAKMGDILQIIQVDR